MNEDFKNRLKELRLEKGLNQAELATKADIQATAISHFENGTRKPSFKNLRNLANALNVTTDYLLGRPNSVKASGPTINALFRHAESMSDEDLKLLETMAQQMAERNKKND